MTGIVVLGMHRSGTSAVSEILARLGGAFCAPDERLFGTEHGTPTAYWESRSLVMFNESLLRAFGGDWTVPPELPAGWPAVAVAAEMAPSALELFTRLHPAPDWVWKDPRLCLTLPFWLRWVLCSPRAVLVVRDPAQVAASLNRRDSIDPRHADLLWRHYLASAVRACQDVPTLVISYARLCRDPLASGALLYEWAFPGLAADDVLIRAAVANIRKTAPGAESGDLPDAPAFALYRTLNRLHGSVIGGGG